MTSSTTPSSSSALPMVPCGVMFHHFHGTGHPETQGSMSAEELEKMLEYIGIERIVSADDFIRRASSDSLLGNEVVLTFDDNLLCQYEVALPVLRAHGLTGIWSVYTGDTLGPAGRLEIFRYARAVLFPDLEQFYEAFFAAIDSEGLGGEVSAALKAVKIEQYLAEFEFYTTSDRRFRFVRDKVLGVERYSSIMYSLLRSFDIDPSSFRDRLWMPPSAWNQLRSEGHVISLHTHTHPTDLKSLPVKEQEGEYRLNSDALQAVMGIKPQVVAHPCGSYSKETLTVLKQLGVRVGFRANMQTIPAPSKLEFPREDHANLLRAMRLR